MSGRAVREAIRSVWLLERARTVSLRLPGQHQRTYVTTRAGC
ncbi:hypothetical protein ACFWA5_49455 [Streptomyces mirabilis]